MRHQAKRRRRRQLRLSRRHFFGGAKGGFHDAFNTGRTVIAARLEVSGGGSAASAASSVGETVGRTACDFGFDRIGSRRRPRPDAIRARLRPPLPLPPCSGCESGASEVLPLSPCSGCDTGASEALPMPPCSGCDATGAAPALLRTRDCRRASHATAFGFACFATRGGALSFCEPFTIRRRAVSGARATKPSLPTQIVEPRRCEADPVWYTDCPWFLKSSDASCFTSRGHGSWGNREFKSLTIDRCTNGTPPPQFRCKSRHTLSGLGCKVKLNKNPKVRHSSSGLRLSADWGRSGGRHGNQPSRCIPRPHTLASRTSLRFDQEFEISGGPSAGPPPKWWARGGALKTPRSESDRSLASRYRAAGYVTNRRPQTVGLRDPVLEPVLLKGCAVGTNPAPPERRLQHDLRHNVGTVLGLGDAPPGLCSRARAPNEKIAPAKFSPSVLSGYRGRIPRTRILQVGVGTWKVRRLAKPTSQPPRLLHVPSLLTC